MPRATSTRCMTAARAREAAGSSIGDFIGSVVGRRGLGGVFPRLRGPRRLLKAPLVTRAILLLEAIPLVRGADDDLAADDLLQVGLDLLGGGDGGILFLEDRIRHDLHLGR